MKNRSVLKGLLTFIIILIAYEAGAQIIGFNQVRWEREKIAPGLIWKKSHTILNDSILQNINILIVNINKRRVSLYYEPGVNSVLSRQAEKAGAIAAVNAGFFNISEGGSVTYIRTGGQITELDTAKKWRRNSNMTGTLFVNRRGAVFIDKAYTNSWYDNHIEYPEVLLTGPLLLSGNKKMQLPPTPLVMNRHPRTIVGKKGNHRIIILTLDGRTDQAGGMTLNEVSDMMILLKCKDAINFDGGGSTTMWISGKPGNGIVNMPSDNRMFDHSGERAVSDILVIR